MRPEGQTEAYAYVSRTPRTAAHPPLGGIPGGQVFWLLALSCTRRCQPGLAV